MTITVVNDLIPPAAVTAWIAPGAGGRRVLGNVSPSSSRTFRFRPFSSTGEYRLEAETVEGRDLRSRSFPIARDDDLRWLLRTNTVEFR